MLTIRQVRNQTDEIPEARSRNRYPTERERERRDLILAAGQVVLARNGRAVMTLPILAAAIRVSPGAFIRQFADIDSLLAELMHRHMTAISMATARIPVSTPNRRAAQRAAYFAFTRFLGGPTAAHRLLTRERHGLPEDLRDGIEHVRSALGEILAGDYGAAAMGLLDDLNLQLFQIEAALAAIAAARPEVLETAQPHNTDQITRPAAPEPAPPPEIRPGSLREVPSAPRQKDNPAAAKRLLAGWETGRPNADRWLPPSHRPGPGAPNSEDPLSECPLSECLVYRSPVYDACSALSDEDRASGDVAYEDRASGDVAYEDRASGDVAYEATAGPY
jgi:AcrR family transcriptional regulator